MFFSGIAWVGIYMARAHFLKGEEVGKEKCFLDGALKREEKGEREREALIPIIKRHGFYIFIFEVYREREIQRKEKNMDIVNYVNGVQVVSGILRRASEM